MSGDPTSGFALDQVSVTSGGTTVLDGVSAQIPARTCTAVVGPSGAGKTTLLRLLTRLTEPTAGRVLLDRTPLPDLDVLALRRRVGLVAQRPVLLTERVTEELRVGRADLPDARIAELLSTVGLPPAFAGRRTAELSGGEAQRVCLARALAVQPQALLLDEPTSALDGVNAALIADLARGHVAGGGTVVLVSHDLTVVRAVAGWALVLADGRLVAAGLPADIDYLEAG